VRDEDFEQLHHLEDTYWWFVGMRHIQAALFDRVVSSAQPVLRPVPERVVLDLGCGTGGNLAWLQRYGPAAMIGGLDVVEQALRFTQSRGDRNVVLASATDLPYATGSCDIATSFDVLVQLPGDGSDEQALTEMYRVLRPGGVAFVRGAAYQWMRSAHDEALHTQRRYSLRTLRDRAERSGFEVVRATYANTLLFPVAAFRRIILMRIGATNADSDVRPLPRGLRWSNRAMIGALRLEAAAFSRPWMRLPFGLSAIVVLRKPLNEQDRS
jgi:SAM-dependent methyltransferase